MDHVIRNRDWWFKPANGNNFGEMSACEHFLFREIDDSPCYLFFPIPHHSRDPGLTRRFGHWDAWVNPEGRCFLPGVLISNNNDEKRLRTGGRTELIEVDPHYVIALLVLRDRPIPRSLAQLVRIMDDPDWPCPMEMKGRDAFVRSGETWVKYGKTLSLVEARFVQALRNAHPRRVSEDVMAQRHKIGDPSQTGRRVAVKLPGMIDRPGPSKNGYGFLRG